MEITSNQRTVLVNAKRKHTPTFLSGDGLNITFQSEILDIGENDIELRNTIPPSHIRQFLDSKEYILQVSMTRFTSSVVKGDGQNLTLPIEETNVIEDVRTAQRVGFTAEEKVTVSLLNPFDNETTVQKPVMDLSTDGLALNTKAPSALFAKGVHFSKITISIDGQPYSTTSGTIVYVRNLMDTNCNMRHQVGIKFDTSIVSSAFASEEDTLREGTAES